MTGPQASLTRLSVVSSGRDRFYDWLRGSPAGLVPLALLVGAGAGGGAVVFRYLIEVFTRIFSGHADYSAAGHAANPYVPWLGMFFVVLAPIVGGLIYGPIVDRFAKEARGHGVPEVMLAIAERGGRIGAPVAVVKSLASALCIGSGGSVGREGPIVQIGSALGSTIGQRLRVPDGRLRILVACGAAGGISATFNAPIAGVFFGLELILQDFQAEAFGVVVLASVTSAVIGRAAFGDNPFLHLPPFTLHSPWEFGLYALLGLLGAVVGVGFIKVLYGTEDFLDGIWRGPEALRPAAGGVLLGLLLLVLPQMYGVGYPVLANGIIGKYALWFLLVLMAGKMLATSLTIGIGGSGGVFAPSLFMGAMLGTAFGDVANFAVPGIAGPAGAYGLVGMAAVFAGAARAPITAVLIIFELTGDYTIILPLMAAVALATGLSNLLSGDTIYTLKLRRRGIDLRRGRSTNLMDVLTVNDAMAPVPDPVGRDLGLNALIARLEDSPGDGLPVTDNSGGYRGTVTAREVEQAVRDNALESTAGDLARSLPTLSADQTLQDALARIVQSDRAGLAVIAPDDSHVIGWITHRGILRTYNEYLQRSVERADARPHQAAPDTQPSTTTPPTTTPPTASTPTPSPAAPHADPTVQRSLTRLQGYRVLDIELTDDHRPAGQRVADVDWPESALLIALRRDGRPISATEQTVLARGDRLTVLVPADTADDLADTVRQINLHPAHVTSSTRHTRAE